MAWEAVLANKIEQIFVAVFTRNKPFVYSFKLFRVSESFLFDRELHVQYFDSTIMCLKSVGFTGLGYRFDVSWGFFFFLFRFLNPAFHFLKNFFRSSQYTSFDFIGGTSGCLVKNGGLLLEKVWGLRSPDHRLNFLLFLE